VWKGATWIEAWKSLNLANKGPGNNDFYTTFLKNSGVEPREGVFLNFVLHGDNQGILAIKKQLQ
jgi:hypothetical protein